MEVEAYERATKRKRVISVTIAVAIVSSPLLYLFWRTYQEHHAYNVREAEYRKSLELDDAQRSELRRMLATSKATLDEARAAWKKAVAPDALDALEVNDNGCDVQLDAPSIDAANSYSQYGSIDGNYFGDLSYTTYATASAIGANPQLDGIDRTLAEIATKLEHDDADKDDLDRARRALAPDHTVFLIGERTEPVVLSDKYIPGTLVGTAYVYDFGRHRIVCMGAIDARNSSSIDIRYSYNEMNVLDKDTQERSAARSTLARDLDIEIRRNIAARVHGAQ